MKRHYEYGQQGWDYVPYTEFVHDLSSLTQIEKLMDYQEWKLMNRVGRERVLLKEKTNLGVKQVGFSA